MGGRGSSSGMTAATMSSFGSLGSGSGGGVSVAQANTPAAAPQIASAPTVPQPVATAQNNANFPAVDNSPFHDLRGGRQYFQNQALSIQGQMATISYLSPNAEPGSLYSPSQNLNYAMSKGLPLNANQQYMQYGLMSSMHNLGQNLNLQRYDHQDFINSQLKQAGITNANYESFTDSQLRSLLVGRTITENRFLSTSHNDFRNAGSGATTFTTRAVRIEYRAKASTQAFMPGNGPGGKLGEVIVAPGQTGRIVDVKFNGRGARLKGQNSSGALNHKQVTVVIEIG